MGRDGGGMQIVLSRSYWAIQIPGIDFVYITNTIIIQYRSHLI